MSLDIPLDLIDADPEQPRQHFDEESIAELAQSFEESGQLTPIMVRPNDGRFVIVHGERRYRAARSLGWKTIRAETRKLDEKDAYVASIVENAQREDLSPIELARAVQRLVEEFELSQSEAGRRIGGKSRSWVAQKLRLLNLPEIACTLTDSGPLTEGHARQLLKLNSAGKGGVIDELAQRAATGGWSVVRLQNEVDLAIAGGGNGDGAAHADEAELTIEQIVSLAFCAGAMCVTGHGFNFAS